MRYKFRAWDKKEKKILYEDSPSGVRSYVIDSNGDISDWDGENLNERLIIMLFTGLLDKNKRPIFEEDIVIFDNVAREEIKRNKQYQVIFQNGLFGVKEFIKIYPLGIYEPSHTEIIGNVYEGLYSGEKTELLKVK